jgi:hypothetical protein
LPDPVIFFFVLGLVARLAKSDLRVPQALYEALAIYLLIAIGLKGGVELAAHPAGGLAPKLAAALAMGFILPVLAFVALRYAGHLKRVDAAAIAGHYGSVSVVTFAVGGAWLSERGIAYEAYMPVFVAVLELPGIIVGILIARIGDPGGRTAWGRVAHEVLLGKGVVLLAGALAIGWLAGPERIAPLKPFFYDLFKGVLAIFLLEMGIVVAHHVRELKRAGPFLALFAIVAPVAFGAIGAATGAAMGLSLGGTTLLAVLAASASYIAAPATMRIALPEANPALSLGAVLGVTFPWNVLAGIPLCHVFAQHFTGN